MSVCTRHIGGGGWAAGMGGRSAPERSSTCVCHMTLRAIACACATQLVLVEAVQTPAAKALTYLHAKGTENRVKPASHWVITDLSNPR